MGSCRAWLEAGNVPRASGDANEIVQECGAGLIRIRRDASTGRLSFAAPPLIRSGALSESELALACSAMGLAPSDVLLAAWLVNGPPWCGLLLKDAKGVLDVKPRYDINAGFVGIVAPYAKAAQKVYEQLGVQRTYEAPDKEHEEASFEVRAFICSPEESCEDPCTGRCVSLLSLHSHSADTDIQSLNAAIAQWLIGSSLAPSAYLASQGARLGRAGQVHVSQSDGEIWIGGDVAVAVTGTVSL